MQACRKDTASPHPGPSPAEALTSSAPGVQKTAAEHPSLEHRFNDDLLLGQADRDVVKALFPDLFHVLNHPELREEFARYERMANHAKGRVHKIGLAAVVLATVALLFSAVTPVLKWLHESPDLSPSAALLVGWLQSFSVVAEIAGLIGATIAIGGLWIAGWKKKWLEGRLMTERLRQWHFQLLIHRGKEVEASCDTEVSQALEKFLVARAQWFSAFLNQHCGKLDAILLELIEAPEACYTPLHEQRSTYSPGSKVLSTVFEAYRILRLRHQAQYAAYKLQQTTSQPPWRPDAWPITVLKQRMAAITSFCLIAALLVSGIIVVSYFAGWSFGHGPALPAVILCLMVLNAATRAIQDGLAIREETQRYNDYCGEVRYLQTRFEASHDTEEKLRLMQEMEHAAIEELKSFLRAHSEARFIV